MSFVCDRHVFCCISKLSSFSPCLYAKIVSSPPLPPMSISSLRLVKENVALDETSVLFLCLATNTRFSSCAQTTSNHKRILQRRFFFLRHIFFAHPLSVFFCLFSLFLGEPRPYFWLILFLFLIQSVFFPTSVSNDGILLPSRRTRARNCCLLDAS